jgi:hypothetical protein
VQFYTQKNIGTISILKDVIAKEGVRRIYHGFPAFAATGLMSAPIFFTMMERSRAFYIDSLHLDHTLASSLAAMTGSMSSQLILVPSDNCVQRQMVAHKSSSTTVDTRSKLSQSFNTLRDLYHEKGLIRGVWKGFFISCLTYTPSSMIFWATYGNLRPIVEGMFKRGALYVHHYQQPQAHHEEILDDFYKTHVPAWQQTTIHVAATALCSAASGATAASLTTPFDVIKTRSQLSHQSARETAKTLFKEHGISGFALGLKMRMFSSAFMFCLFVTSYDLMKDMVTKK